MHTIDAHKNIMEINKTSAERNRKIFDKNNVFAINIMGATGSGKTIMIETLSKKLMTKFKIKALVGDIVSKLDADRIKSTGIEAKGINTGTECHLDSHLISHAIEDINLKDTDLLLIENVGNLICPTDFNLGEHKRIVVVSSSEGDDTVEKHPMIFLTADLCIINKTDIADAVNANVEKMADDAKMINPKIKVFKTSFKNGDGVDEVIGWILKSMGEYKQKQKI
ncbi:MAG: hydrogenase accessory protein HypB [Candidatus Altiarchaeales archaeon HGW-Altiarchaeales-1]|nr:MAG: hydrogenase accessory protein HypB [Candidatus Altiarchaeales archaeon HGW-Altiarchaeales-1]